MPENVVSRWLSPDPMGAELLKTKPSTLEAINWFVYCENNPLKYIDPEGLSKTFMRFDKSDKKMDMVFVPTNEYGSIDYRNIVVKMDDNAYDANSTVKSFDEPTPKTTPKNGNGKNYHPIRHPNGKFEVSASQESDTDAYGPLYMDTSASPEVETYTYDQELGEYILDEDTQTDSGYRIHGGGYSTDDPSEENNYLDNTRGCIRMPNGQLVDLASYVDKAAESTNGETELEVRD